MESYTITKKNFFKLTVNSYFSVMSVQSRPELRATKANKAKSSMALVPKEVVVWSRRWNMHRILIEWKFQEMHVHIRWQVEHLRWPFRVNLRRIGENLKLNRNFFKKIPCTCFEGWVIKTLLPFVFLDSYKLLSWNKPRHPLHQVSLDLINLVSLHGQEISMCHQTPQSTWHFETPAFSV